MGRQSTRANKNIYQICREECELTRERASEMMTGVSASRIEKIEYNLQDPTPYDIVQMADCYKRPNECYDLSLIHILTKCNAAVVWRYQAMSQYFKALFLKSFIHHFQ